MKQAAKPRILIPVFCLLLSACSFGQRNLPSRTSITPGETITVQGDQNIYAVAQANNASMREIIVLNNLQPPFTIKPGQQLILPAGANGVSATAKEVMPSVTSAPAGDIEAVPLAPVQAAPVQSQVESLNSPLPPSKPVATTVTASPSSALTPTPSPPPPVPESKPSSASLPSVDMKWPAQGPVLSKFGPKGQGLNNDGVNIGAPKGSPVTAAANGIVVYSGNEMKGFGNLILIRHEGGWVTAYAHLDRMLVNKDAIVAQGDMIGTVGKTGNVPSPQLHFEIRYNGKPVDPGSVIK